MKSLDDIFKEFSGFDGLPELLADCDYEFRNDLTIGRLKDFIRAREEKLKASLKTLLACECGIIGEHSMENHHKENLKNHPEKGSLASHEGRGREIDQENRVREFIDDFNSCVEPEERGDTIYGLVSVIQEEIEAAKEPHLSPKPKDERVCPFCGGKPELIVRDEQWGCPKCEKQIEPMIPKTDQGAL